MEEQMESFRRRLRERRVEVGLSARALGLAIGKGNSYVQSLESGLRGRDLPDYGTIVKLAQKLDVEPEWLARGKGPGPLGPPAPTLVTVGPPGEERAYPLGEVLAFVESFPGDEERAQLRAMRRELDPDDYERGVVGIFQRWAAHWDDFRRFIGDDGLKRPH